MDNKAERLREVITPERVEKARTRSPNEIPDSQWVGSRKRSHRTVESRRSSADLQASAGPLDGLKRTTAYDSRSTHVLSIVNRKGGVGKTTTAFNLAGALSQKGHQVLVIDMDPMGSLCRSLQIRPGEKTLSDLLVGVGGNLGDLICKTRIPNLFVIPGDPNLRTLEMRFGTSLEYRRALSGHLDEVLKWKPFPFVIIDCPPSLGLISGNALIAASDALIPIDGSAYGMGALVDTMGIIKLVQQNVNKNLRICGLLLNNVDLSTTYDQTVREVLKSEFGDLLFDTVIPTSPESDVCSQVGEPVTRHAPSSWMAKAYRQLVDELFARCSHRNG